jgi:hypothetical protein
MEAKREVGTRSSSYGYNVSLVTAIINVTFKNAFTVIQHSK